MKKTFTRLEVESVEERLQLSANLGLAIGSDGLTAPEESQPVLSQRFETIQEESSRHPTTESNSMRMPGSVPSASDEIWDWRKTVEDI